MTKDVQASNAAERQALLVVDAAYDVAASLQAQRHALAKHPRSSHRKALMEAAERLVNLIMLAAQRLSDEVGPEVRDHVHAKLSELRDRLLATGTGLVADRAESITRRVQTVTGERTEYPLGLANKMAVVLSNVEQAVEAMGGDSHLDDEVRSKLSDARQAVARLHIIEAEHELEEL